MSITVTEIIMILAAAQGFFLTLFLVQKYARVYAARFVAALIFLYSFTVMAMVVNDLGYAMQIEALYAAFLAIPFVLGPLHYFFALHLIRPERRFSKNDGLNFLPFIFFLIFLPLMVSLSNTTLIAGNQSIDGLVPPHFIVFNWIIFGHATTYTILSLRKLRAHAKKVKDLFSSLEKIQLKWLTNITYLALFVVGIFGIENLLMSLGINATNYFTGSSVMVAVYVYAFGYMTILRLDIFLDPRVKLSMQQAPEENAAELAASRQKYQKSGLSTEKAQEYLDRLVSLMQAKKPFQDNGLTLDQLAEMVEMSPHNLSEVLNTQLGQNFFDFINSYRVEEVKSALVDAKKQHLTLLAIAFDAGFNSKTAFNTIFKKATGKTPSEYRQGI